MLSVCVYSVLVLPLTGLLALRRYNSGGKSFTQIHTKHLSVTIDAFTIHDALWQGKRASLPSKKDMTLVT